MSVIPKSPVQVALKKRTGETKQIVVHCSASGPTSTWGWKEINQMHVRDNGWAAIGYHVVIKRSKAFPSRARGKSIHSSTEQ